MQTVPTWRTIELTFQSSIGYANPYGAVDVDATFVGPGGVAIRRPAYWDGGRTWKVRFAPTAPGAWRYTVSCSDATNTGLHGSTGEICAVAGNAQSVIDGHGFLAKADGPYLAHADGTPFFWLGDTHWQFLAERWDEANKPGWSSQFRGMVDHRVEQGFTVYQSNLMMLDWSGGPSRYWVDGELFGAINVAFLQNVVDPRMAYIADRGLVNALGIGWYEAVDTDVAGLQRFARYIVARYGSYPMVWTLGGEVAGYDLRRRQARIDGWRAVALTICSEDGYHHPLTAHATVERPIAPYYQKEPWLTLTLNQHGHGDFDLDTSHYDDYVTAHPGTPLAEGESLYEGLITMESAGRRPVTDTMVRQSAYRAIQSGCCGCTYGAQGCWNAAWNNEDRATTWGDLPWDEGIDLPGAKQLGYLRKFYDNLPWTRLRRTRECFTSQSVFSSTIYAPQVTADPEMDTVVVYFGETYRAGDGAAALTHLQDSPYTVRWFDPRVGVSDLIEDCALPVDGVLPIPDKPDNRDWLLWARTTKR